VHTAVQRAERRGAPFVARPPLVCWFDECLKESVPLVGGKNASLGELINAQVRVPPGFALTTEGYRRFMAEAGLELEVAARLACADTEDLEALERISASIRSLIEDHPFPQEIEDLVAECYRKLSLRSCLPAVPVAPSRGRPARHSPESRPDPSVCARCRGEGSVPR